MRGRSPQADFMQVVDLPRARIAGSAAISLSMSLSAAS